MSLHEVALAELLDWQPDPEQTPLRDRFVAHLRSHQDGVWRQCAGAHLTCGVLVVDHTATKVLMNLHGKAGIWVHFGGHCEPGDESLIGTATRELLEESGLDRVEVDPVIAQLDIHRVDFCRPHGTVDHLDVRFVARAGPGAVHQASEESTEVRWFDIAQAPTTEPTMVDLIRIARDRFAD